jgi:hypothetical protein
MFVRDFVLRLLIFTLRQSLLQTLHYLLIFTFTQSLLQTLHLSVNIYLNTKSLTNITFINVMFVRDFVLR